MIENTGLLAHEIRGGWNSILHGHPLWKSLGLSLLMKVFCLLSDHSKACTKCRTTIEALYHKVALKLVKRWRIFINGEFLLWKIRSSWIWATPAWNIFRFCRISHTLSIWKIFGTLGTRLRELSQILFNFPPLFPS